MAAEQVRAYVGLGSNLDSPASRVSAAVDGLASLPDTRLDTVSRLYRSPPWGVEEQPDFINAVAALDTGLAPDRMLARLQELEKQAGRDRAKAERWGPRVLDLDLLLYGDTVSSDPRLMLPHPRMHERAFVLVPLLEIAPGIRIPGRGDAAGCLAGLDAAGVVPLETDG